MSSLPIHVTCPVCNRENVQGNICTKCGWQFVVFSSRPDDKIVDHFKNIIDIKTKQLSELEKLQASISGLQAEIKELEPKFKYLEESYNEFQKESIEYSKLREEAAQKREKFSNTDAFIKEINDLELQIERLEAHIPKQDIFISRLPGVTFRCHYLKEQYKLEVEVVEIHDFGLEKINDFVLGVVFSKSTIHHYLDAEIIIPTKIIRAMTNLEIYQKTQLELQYVPPKGMTYQQTIQLYYHNLSLFSLE